MDRDLTASQHDIAEMEILYDELQREEEQLEKELKRAKEELQECQEEVRRSERREIELGSEIQEEKEEVVKLKAEHKGVLLEVRELTQTMLDLTDIVVDLQKETEDDKK